jgi:hypothetical protein
MRLRALGLALPMLAAQCAPVDNPPTVSSSKIICDISRCNPETVTFAVWGEEGWVEADLFCTNDPDRYSTWYTEVDPGAWYFPGGGDSMNPTTWTLRCPSYTPYAVTRLSSAWSWD